MDNGKDLLEMVVTGFETAEEDIDEDEEAFNFSECGKGGQEGGEEALLLQQVTLSSATQPC
jgi:hypothetical protein